MTENMTVLSWVMWLSLFLKLLYLYICMKQIQYFLLQYHHSILVLKLSSWWRYLLKDVSQHKINLKYPAKNHPNQWSGVSKMFCCYHYRQQISRQNSLYTRKQNGPAEGWHTGPVPQSPKHLQTLSRPTLSLLIRGNLADATVSHSGNSCT